MERFDDYIVNDKRALFKYKDLVTTKESRYSCVMPWHHQQVKNVLLKELKNIDYDEIVDATAHIGCDAILFHTLFPNKTITAIELDTQVYNLLVENVKSYKVQTVNDDFLDWLYDQYDLKYKIVYMDPPWSQDYAKYDYFDLYLSGVPLWEIVSDVLDKQPELVILKLPYNINMVLFDNLGQITYEIYEIKKPKGDISYLLCFIYP